MNLNWKAKTGGVVVALATVLFLVVVSLSPAQSQSRAESSLNVFTAGMAPLKNSCTYDSDGDGFASCTSIQATQTLTLQCSSGLMTLVPLLGSKSCKMQPNEVIKLR